MFLLLLGSCSDSGEKPLSSDSEIKQPFSKEKTDTELARFDSIEWTDLMPKDDMDALLNPPTYITDIQDGSLEDMIGSQLQNLSDTTDDRYQQALVSTRIMPEMNGKSIRLPGYIVPIEHNDNKSITSFFLVPFFGACIHLPPPPPNQIIYVNYPKGFDLESIYEPHWVYGDLKTSLKENEMATSAYAMDMHHYEIYIETYTEPSITD